MSYHCHVCGEDHDDLPHIGTDKPDHWWDVAEEERSRRIFLGEDICDIDQKHFFIRGVIEIPVHDYPEIFGFGVWVSQKKENFQTYLASFDTPDIGPFFGWLSTRIGYYPESTLSLKTNAIFKGQGMRPRIDLWPTENHQLALDQRNGITLAKAWEIVHFYS